MAKLTFRHLLKFVNLIHDGKIGEDGGEEGNCYWLNNNNGNNTTYALRSGIPNAVDILEFEAVNCDSDYEQYATIVFYPSKNVVIIHPTSSDGEVLAEAGRIYGIDDEIDFKELSNWVLQKMISEYLERTIAEYFKSEEPRESKTFKTFLNLVRRISDGTLADPDFPISKCYVCRGASSVFVLHAIDSDTVELIRVPERIAISSSESDITVSTQKDKPVTLCKFQFNETDNLVTLVPFNTINRTVMTDIKGFNLDDSLDELHFTAAIEADEAGAIFDAISYFSGLELSDQPQVIACEWKPFCRVQIIRSEYSKLQNNINEFLESVISENLTMKDVVIDDVSFDPKVDNTWQYALIRYHGVEKKEV